MFDFKVCSFFILWYYLIKLVFAFLFVLESKTGKGEVL